MNAYTWMVSVPLQVSQHHEPVSGPVGVSHGACLRDFGQPPGHSHSHEGRDQRGWAQNPSGTCHASLCLALWRHCSLPSLCHAAGVFCCLLKLFSKHSYLDLSSRESRDREYWCCFGHYCLPEVNHSFVGICIQMFTVLVLLSVELVYGGSVLNLRGCSCNAVTIFVFLQVEIGFIGCVIRSFKWLLWNSYTMMNKLRPF